MITLYIVIFFQKIYDSVHNTTSRFSKKHLFLCKYCVVQYGVSLPGALHEKTQLEQITCHCTLFMKISQIIDFQGILMAMVYISKQQKIQLLQFR